MVTLSDIAKRCETSVATVSYVLSGQGNKHKISDAMQQKIIKASHDMGYRKNRAKPSASGRTVIAICWPHRNFETTIANMLIGISSVVTDKIDPVDIIIKPFEYGKLDQHGDLWQGNVADAAIIMAATTEDIDYLERNKPSIPLVLINRLGTSFSCVSIDDDTSGLLAATHAISKAQHDICLVLNPDPIYGLKKRASIMLDVCNDNNIDMEDKVYFCKNSIDDGYELGLEFLRKNRLSKVIVCVYDMVALGIMSALNENGIKIGEDVEIIATSTGLPGLFARSSPPMTVVDLKIEEVTVQSIRLAHSLATNRLKAPQTLTVTPEIIYRVSSPLNA